MCFSGEMSAAFAALGLLLTWWIKTRTCNNMLAAGVFFYFTMEMLQAIQYFYGLATDLGTSGCDDLFNKFLTIIGFVHICAQPFFCHIINEALSQKPQKGFSDAHNRKLSKYHHQYQLIRKLCILGGLMVFARWPMSYIPGWSPTINNHSYEWIRGNEICMFKNKSMYHLGWSIPMADATYNIAGISLHLFLMFGPFFAMYEKRGMVVQGCFLYLTGPFMASLITPNLFEQASIWCFGSIAQIAVMLFLIRDTLIVKWGRGAHGTGKTMVELGKNRRAAQEEVTLTEKKGKTKHKA